ncbi:hypothetical protein [Rhizobium sp.]|uniref:hypothetical protein n=1 Tax=Rhizobium sp. TaxID=391 RepID=UPI00289DE162
MEREAVFNTRSAPKNSMKAKFFNQLNAIDDVLLYPRLARDEWDEISKRSQLKIPSDHVDAPMESNGALVHGRYAKLFGVGEKASIDINVWTTSISGNLHRRIGVRITFVLRKPLGVISMHIDHPP